jgi:hypothetical protein
LVLKVHSGSINVLKGLVVCGIILLNEIMIGIEFDLNKILLKNQDRIRVGFEIVIDLK